MTQRLTYENLHAMVERTLRVLSAANPDRLALVKGVGAGFLCLRTMRAERAGAERATTKATRRAVQAVRTMQATVQSILEELPVDPKRPRLPEADIVEMATALAYTMNGGDDL